jgi:hypothetical protein
LDDDRFLTAKGCSGSGLKGIEPSKASSFSSLGKLTIGG